MKGRTVICAAVALCGALGCAGQAPKQPTWLNPSDVELQAAITRGYEMKPPKRKYVQIEVGAYGSGAGQSVRIESPLICAYDHATFAAKHLDPKPTLDQTRALCAGEIEVDYEVNISYLRSDYAVALLHGGKTFRPVNKLIDSDPAIVDGFLGPHYDYFNSFWIKPDSAWAGKATLEYSNGASVSRATVDFSAFVKDEEHHR